MATLGTDKQWWPANPPTRQPDEVDMDTTRRETRRNVNLRLPFHDAQCAVVCHKKDATSTRKRTSTRTRSSGDQVRGRARARAHRGVRRARRRGGTARIAAAPSRDSRGPTGSGVGVARRSNRAGALDVPPRTPARSSTPTSSSRRTSATRKSSGTTAVVAHIVRTCSTWATLGTREQSWAPLAGASTQRGRLGHRRGDARPDVLQEGERERMRRRPRPVLFATLGMILGETPLSGISTSPSRRQMIHRGSFATAPRTRVARSRSLGDTVGKRLGFCPSGAPRRSWTRTRGVW